MFFLKTEDAIDFLSTVYQCPQWDPSSFSECESRSQWEQALTKPPNTQPHPGMIHTTFSNATSPFPRESSKPVKRRPSAGIARPRSATTTSRESARDLAERLVALCFLVDMFVLVAAQLAAYGIRFQLLHEFGNVEGITPLSSYVHYIGAGTFFMLSLLGTFHVYQKLRPLRKLETIVIEFMKAIGIWLLLCAMGSYVFKMSPAVSRLYLVLAATLMCGSLISWRYVFHCLLVRSGVLSALSTRVVFLGWTEDSARLHKALTEGSEHRHNIVGCVPAPGEVRSHSGFRHPCAWGFFQH